MTIRSIETGEVVETTLVTLISFMRRRSLVEAKLPLPWQIRFPPRGERKGWRVFQKTDELDEYNRVIYREVEEETK